MGNEYTPAAPPAGYGTLWGSTWWDILLRGIISILFGLALFFWPGLSLAIFVLLFGAFAFFDGLLMVLHAISVRKSGSAWLAGLAYGILSIIAGIAVLVWPGLTLFIFAYILAAYWFVMGILTIIYAFQMRKAITGELLLIATGVLAVVVGIILFVYPLVGILALAQVIGIFNIAFGIILALLGIKLKLAPEGTAVRA